MKSIIYIIDNEILNPIIESQVLRPLSHDLSVEKTFVITVLPIGILLRKKYYRKLKEVIACAQQKYKVEIVVAWRGLSRMQWKWLDYALLYAKIKKATNCFSQIEIRSRGGYVSAIVQKCVKRLGSGKIKTVFDCRGDGPSEYLGRVGVDPSVIPSRDTSIYSKWIECQREERNACESDEIIVVSNKMADMLVERHGVDRSKIIVRPCAVDLNVFKLLDRYKIKNNLKVQHRFVVCYLGSMDWYQLPDQSVRIFKIIQKICSNALFLGITTNPDLMEQSLIDKGINGGDFFVLTVPSSEIPNYLHAADIGLLLRESNPVNNVASPVKFAEYLACGVPVLLTPGIGDYSSLVEEEGLGACIDLGCSDEILEGLLKEFINEINSNMKVAIHCRDYVEKNLTWL